MLGPNIKSRGSRGHPTVSKCRPHHSGDILQGETICEPVFHIRAKMYKKICIFWAILGALRGCSMIRLGLSCFPDISSHPYIRTCQVRKQSNNKFLTLNPKYENWGSWGGPYVKPKFQGSKTSQSRHGWPINNRTGPILLPSDPLTYINLHIKYENNLIMIFKVIA